MNNGEFNCYHRRNVLVSTFAQHYFHFCFHFDEMSKLTIRPIFISIFCFVNLLDTFFSFEFVLL